MGDLTVGSLFSGIGGLDLGLERAGMRVIWNAEVDPYCCQVLKKHWPTVPNLGDVTTIDWSTVERPDVVAGGYPCQPFSSSGLRRGSDDVRHLWPHMFDAVRLLRPRYVIAENVPGHLSLGFDRVLADLASVGFDAEWSLVPACAMGAPHSRERLYFVAHTEGDGWDGLGLQTAAPALGCAGHVDREPEGSGTAPHWASVRAPSTIGMAHGVPTVVDRARLRGHGNAVVPQVAEHVGRLVVDR